MDKLETLEGVLYLSGNTPFLYFIFVNSSGQCG